MGILSRSSFFKLVCAMAACWGKARSHPVQRDFLEFRRDEHFEEHRPASLSLVGLKPLRTGADHERALLDTTAIAG